MARDAEHPDTDRLVAAVLDGAADPTRDLLTTASGGDPVLLRALILTGLGLGELTCRDGRWWWGAGSSRSRRLAKLIGDRSAGRSARQLMALGALTEPLARPYAVVTAQLDDRAARCAAAPAVRLTQREWQILTLLGEGLTGQAIARRLSLSPRTVAKYQERMYRKFGTSDRLATVVQAQRLGLLRAGVSSG